MKNKTDDLKSKVSFYIKGKHGMIGVIMPDNPPTESELKDLYKTLAEIAVKNAKYEKHEETIKAAE